MSDKKYTRSKPKKYLVFENGSVPNSDTRKFFTKRRKIEKHIVYSMVSPNDEHSTVTHKILDFTKALVIAPTVYVPSTIIRMAHDIDHSCRRKGMDFFKLEEIFIIDTLHNLARGVQWAGRDAIAGIAGILSRVTTYVLDENGDPYLLTQDEFFKMMRGYLYDDSNRRYEDRYYMDKLETINNPLIQIASPDKTILYIHIPYGEVIAGINAKNHWDLLMQSKLPMPEENKQYGAGWIDVYHGNKRLVFRSFTEKENASFRGLSSLDDTVSELDLYFQVYYPGYEVMFS